MTDMDFLCLLCGDTGKWAGSPEPCPDCGAYAPLRKARTPKPEKKWRQQDNYRSIGGRNPASNRNMRRKNRSKQSKYDTPE